MNKPTNDSLYDSMTQEQKNECWQKTAPLMPTTPMKQSTTQQGKPLVNVLTGLTNSEEKVNALYRTLDKAWKTSFKLEQKGIISSEVMAGLEDSMNALRKQFSK